MHSGLAQPCSELVLCMYNIVFTYVCTCVYLIIKVHHGTLNTYVIIVIVGLDKHKQQECQSLQQAAQFTLARGCFSRDNVYSLDW